MLQLNTLNQTGRGGVYKGTHATRWLLFLKDVSLKSQIVYVKKKRKEMSRISSSVNCEGYNFWVHDIFSGIDCFGKGLLAIILYFLSGCQNWH